jgi:hypothetical protein
MAQIEVHKKGRYSQHRLGPPSKLYSHNYLVTHTRARETTWHILVRYALITGWKKSQYWIIQQVRKCTQSLTVRCIPFVIDQDFKFFYILKENDWSSSILIVCCNVSRHRLHDLSAFYSDMYNWTCSSLMSTPSKPYKGQSVSITSTNNCAIL